MKIKQQALIIILITLAVLIVHSHTGAQSIPLTPNAKAQPFIVSFTINDNIIFTTGRTVTLTYRVRGGFTHFHQYHL